MFAGEKSNSVNGNPFTWPKRVIERTKKKTQAHREKERRKETLPKGISEWTLSGAGPGIPVTRESFPRGPPDKTKKKTKSRKREGSRARQQNLASSFHVRHAKETETKRIRKRVRHEKTA